MASLTQWTWIWANSGRQWRTGKPGMLRNNLVTEQQQKQYFSWKWWFTLRISICQSSLPNPGCTFTHEENFETRKVLEPHPWRCWWTGLRRGPDTGIYSKSTWHGHSELPGCELPLWGIGLFLGNGTSQKSPNLSEHHLETRTITSFKTDKSAVLQSSHKWLFANIPKAWMVIMLNINIVIVWPTPG